MVKQLLKKTVKFDLNKISNHIYGIQKYVTQLQG